MSEERVKLSLGVLFADELEFILGGLRLLTIDTLCIEGENRRSSTRKGKPILHSRIDFKKDQLASHLRQKKLL